jgi:hypothetical protein
MYAERLLFCAYYTISTATTWFLPRVRLRFRLSSDANPLGLRLRHCIRHLSLLLRILSSQRSHLKEPHDRNPDAHAHQKAKTGLEAFVEFGSVCHGVLMVVD